MVTAFQLAGLGAAGRTPRQQGGQRHTAAQALAQGDDVGAHAVGLLGQQRAATAHAGLHLIQDQQDAQFAAQALDTLEVLLGGRDHPGLALDRLEHDRHGTRVHCCMQRGQIVERHLAETRQAGLAAVARRRVGGRQRPQAAPVAALARSDDVVGAIAMQLAPLARQLDRTFAGFGTTVEQ
uniref:Transcriptional regulator n=1 Tax=Steinernema glaseri TaxID=37863 RepID=A0A1I7ZDB5_9BILA